MAYAPLLTVFGGLQPSGAPTGRVPVVNLVTNPAGVTTEGVVDTPDGPEPGVEGFVQPGDALAWQSTVRAFRGSVSVAVVWSNDLLYPGPGTTVGPDTRLIGF